VQINKKILLAALSISFHGAVMSMEQAELKQHAESVSEYIQNTFDKRYEQNIQLLAKWLVQKRDNISDTDTWNDLIKELHDKIQVPQCNPDHLKMPTSCGCGFITAHRKVIIDKAYKLQPNQNDTQLIKDIEQGLYREIYQLLPF